MVGPPRPPQPAAGSSAAASQAAPRAPPPRFHEPSQPAVQPREGTPTHPAEASGAALAAAAGPAATAPADASIATDGSALSGADGGREDLPTGYEVRLQGHHKVVSALDVDRAGVRVVTGGMDYQTLLYDFNGMKADCKPFRELMPHEGHPVHAVSFSPSGDAFFAVTGEPRAKVLATSEVPRPPGHARYCCRCSAPPAGATARLRKPAMRDAEPLSASPCCIASVPAAWGLTHSAATCMRCMHYGVYACAHALTGGCVVQVYDREGREKGVFKRGDMYLRDLKNTKGHVSSCTDGQWHPVDRQSALTSSTDGTLRLWDCEAIEQKMVIKPTGASGRVPVTACTYSPDGRYIAGAPGIRLRSCDAACASRRPRQPCQWLADARWMACVHACCPIYRNSAESHGRSVAADCMCGCNRPRAGEPGRWRRVCRCALVPDTAAGLGMQARWTTAQSRSGRHPATLGGRRRWSTCRWRARNRRCSACRRGNTRQRRATSSALRSPRAAR